MITKLQSSRDFERCEHGKIRGFPIGEPCQACVDSIPLQKTQRERFDQIERAMILVCRMVYVSLGAKPLDEGEIKELDSILSEIRK